MPALYHFKPLDFRGFKYFRGTRTLLGLRSALCQLSPLLNTAIHWRIIFKRPGKFPMVYGLLAVLGLLAFGCVAKHPEALEPIPPSSICGVMPHDCDVPATPDCPSRLTQAPARGTCSMWSARVPRRRLLLGVVVGAALAGLLGWAATKPLTVRGIWCRVAHRRRHFCHWANRKARYFGCTACGHEFAVKPARK